MGTLPTVVLLASFFSISESCLKVYPVDPGMPANSACKRCAPITIGMNRPDQVQFIVPGGTVSNDGACTTTTFDCKVVRRTSIDMVFVPTDTIGILDANDGKPGDGMVTVQLTCNGDGTGWTLSRPMLPQPVTVKEIYCTDTMDAGMPPGPG